MAILHSEIQPVKKGLTVSFDIPPDAKIPRQSGGSFTTWLRKIPALLSCIVIGLLLIDIVITTDKERLLASLRSFAEAGTRDEPHLVQDNLSEDFLFQYDNVLELNREQFFINFTRFCELPGRTSVEDYDITIEGHVALADITYMLYGAVAIRMNQGELGKGAEVKIRMHWELQDAGWMITRIELIQLGEGNTRLPIYYPR